MCLMLNEICAKENVFVTAEELKVFAESLNGDMRRAINELQASAYSKRNLIDMSKEFTTQYQEVFNLINKHEQQKALDILLDEVSELKDKINKIKFYSNYLNDTIRIKTSSGMVV